MELTKLVGQRLKEVRKSRGYTQTQVAQMMGQVYQQYWKYENGRYQLNYEQMVAICRFLDVSADYLLGLSDY